MDREGKGILNQEMTKGDAPEEEAEIDGHGKKKQ